MTDLREAAQQALEALEQDNPAGRTATITALKAALAQEQAEQVREPVAKVELMMTGGNAGLATRIVEIDDHLRERLRPGQLLYTAEPTRKPLTDEEIALISAECAASHQHTDWHFARAIERAHGIGV